MGYLKRPRLVGFSINGFGTNWNKSPTLCHCPFCTKSQRKEDNNPLNQRLQIETKGKESWQNFYHGTYSSIGAGSPPKLLHNPVPTRRILLVDRPFFRIWGYYASPLLLARRQKNTILQSPPPSNLNRRNEMSVPMPLLLNNQIWRHIKISFHYKDGRYLGSCNYDSFHKTQFVIPL